MSVEQADEIDGIEVQPTGAVELLISDHLAWDVPDHLNLLAAKIELYANAVLSGLLVKSFPEARGKEICIRLVWQHAPNEEAARFFASIEPPLRDAGIGFKQGPSPQGRKST